MEIKNIETFLKVAANQNLSKTASQIGYSQSAVTVQIQKLEKELGVQLFERIGKRIYLTSQGSAFLPYATDILKASEAAMNFAKGETVPSGLLRIGGVESVCTAVLPELLPKFYRLCPDVEVMVRSGYTEDMLDLLDSNDLDTVFTIDEKICRNELVCEAEQDEDIIFVTTPGTLKEPETVITAEKLCSFSFILTEHQAPYRHEFERLLAKRNLTVRPVLEIGNTETIINMLKKGRWISLLPRFTVEKDIADGKLTEVLTDLPDIKISQQILCHKGKWITPQLKIFIELAEEYFKENIR